MPGTEDLKNLPEDELAGNKTPRSNPDDDGRNKEWQDRARVNLEQTPDGVHTNVERDFEPENPEQGNIKKETPPAY